MTAFYNEIDPYAADWLENLITAGLIAPGVVDRRSIVDIQPADLAGFTQVHLFAGVGGWSLAARLAGWEDTRSLWTGSCPCQPFSVAGKGAGEEDARHLWPEFFRLIAACRPAVVMGEQVAAAVGKSWLDGVFADLESIAYTGRAAVVPACAVNAPHRRDRLWFVADGDGERWAPRHGDGSTLGHGNSATASGCHVGDGHGKRLERLGTNHDPQRWQGQNVGSTRLRDGAWSHAELVNGADGKARRVKSGIRLLAYGVSGRVAIRRPVEQAASEIQEHWYNRVGALKGFGNAIVPQVAAEIIGAYLDTHPSAAPLLSVPPLSY